LKPNATAWAEWGNAGNLGDWMHDQIADIVDGIKIVLPSPKLPNCTESLIRAGRACKNRSTNVASNNATEYEEKLEKERKEGNKKARAKAKQDH